MSGYVLKEYVIRHIPIMPVAKPRMTRGDKWQKRPAVLRYWAYCEELRLKLKDLPETFHVTFHLPVPKSATKAEAARLIGAPHRKKPDADNLLKALLDAMHKNDAHIWDCRVTKRWSKVPGITIEPLGLSG